MIGEFLLSAWFTALLLGGYDATREMPDTDRAVAAQVFEEIVYGPLEPEEAMDWFLKKIPMDKSMRKLLMRFIEKEGARLEDYRALIFTMGGIENIRMLQVVKDSLLQALKDGTTFRDWKQNMDKYFASAGYSAEDPWHLETVFRTNLFSAYNAGRYRQGMDTIELLPYWQYKAVLDGRERASHRMMHNFTARKDDPVWDVWFPPNGFNCRCTVISLTEERASRELAAKDADGAHDFPPQGMPDDGFMVNPGKQDNTMLTRLQDIQGQAKRQLDEGWPI